MIVPRFSGEDSEVRGTNLRIATAEDGGELELMLLFVRAT
jgi:hypothetical protein